MTASTTISMEPVRIQAHATKSGILQVYLNDESYNMVASLFLHGDPQDIAWKLMHALKDIAYPPEGDRYWITLPRDGIRTPDQTGTPYRASGAGVAWTGKEAPTEV